MQNLENLNKLSKKFLSLFRNQIRYAHNTTKYIDKHSRDIYFLSKYDPNESVSMGKNLGSVQHP